MTEYYILEQETQRADTPIIKHTPEGMEALDFYSGSVKSDVQSPVIIEVTANDQVVFPDAFTYLLPLFSGRLRKILDQLGVDNIQYYEVEIIDHNTKQKLAKKYWLADIIGVIDCIDKEKSEGKYNSILEKYRWKSFVIDLQKTCGAKIFRPYGAKRLILIDETIQKALESEKLEAVRLRNTRDYDGF